MSIKYARFFIVLLFSAAVAHANPAPTGVAPGVPGGHTTTTGVPGAAPSGGGVPGSGVTGNSVPGGQASGALPGSQTTTTGVPGGQTSGAVPGSQTTTTDIPGSSTFIPPTNASATAATTGATLGNIPAGSLSFQAINRSGNGYITPEEWARAGLSDGLFRQMDTNNDKLISGAEYDAHPLNRGAQ